MYVKKKLVKNKFLNRGAIGVHISSIVIEFIRTNSNLKKNAQINDFLLL